MITGGWYEGVAWRFDRRRHRASESRTYDDVEPVVTLAFDSIVCDSSFGSALSWTKRHLHEFRVRKVGWSSQIWRSTPTRHLLDIVECQSSAVHQLRLTKIEQTYRHQHARAATH